MTAMNPPNSPTTGYAFSRFEGVNFGFALDMSPYGLYSHGNPCNTVSWVSTTSSICSTPSGAGALHVTYDLGAQVVGTGLSLMTYDGLICFVVTLIVIACPVCG